MRSNWPCLVIVTIKIIARWRFFLFTGIIKLMTPKLEKYVSLYRRKNVCSKVRRQRFVEHNLTSDAILCRRTNSLKHTRALLLLIKNHRRTLYKRRLFEYVNHHHITCRRESNSLSLHLIAFLQIHASGAKKPATRWQERIKKKTPPIKMRICVWLITHGSRNSRTGSVCRALRPFWQKCPACCDVVSPSQATSRLTTQSARTNWPPPFPQRSRSLRILKYARPRHVWACTLRAPSLLATRQHRTQKYSNNLFKRQLITENNLFSYLELFERHSRAAEKTEHFWRGKKF